MLTDNAAAEAAAIAILAALLAAKGVDEDMVCLYANGVLTALAAAFAASYCSCSIDFEEEKEDVGGKGGLAKTSCFTAVGM